MRARTRTRWAGRGVIAVIAVGAFLADFSDIATLASVPSAEAQYGTSRRVARRTARRTSRRQVAYAGAAGGYSTAPPANCISTGAAWECGGVHYQQAMQNDQVVYVPTEE